MEVTIYKYIPKGGLTAILMKGLAAGDLVTTSIPTNKDEGRIAEFKVDKSILKKDGMMWKLNSDVSSKDLVKHWAV